MNDTTGVHRGSSCQSKIALFRSLVRGREDVYPRRFESLRTGKSGYPILLRRFGIEPSLDDQCHSGVPISVSFQGDLRPQQQMAASAMLAHDTGVLAATTAFGKTVVAAWLIAERGVNALILVHRKQLMEQWTDRLCEILDITEREIGRLGGGRKKLKGRIDIATIQSLIRHGEVDDRIADCRSSSDV